MRQSKTDNETVIYDIQNHFNIYLPQRFHDQIGVIGSSIGSRLGLAQAEDESRVRSLLCHTLFISEYRPDPWHWVGSQRLVYTVFWMPEFKIGIPGFIGI